MTLSIGKKSKNLNIEPASGSSMCMSKGPQGTGPLPLEYAPAFSLTLRK